jgi:hypothetical protein
MKSEVLHRRYLCLSIEEPFNEISTYKRINENVIDDHRKWNAQMYGIPFMSFIHICILKWDIDEE